MKRTVSGGKKPAAAATPAPPRRRAAKAAEPAPLAGVEPAEEDAALAPALAHVVGYLLRRAHNAFQTYWMLSFRHSDVPITPVQGGMLVVVASNPGLTQTALARMMNVEGPTLMQSIDRLEQRGYLQRVRRPGDRRSYSLQITPHGREALTAIQAFLPQRDEELLADLDGDEVKELARLLTKIVNRGYARLQGPQRATPQSVRVEPAPAPRTRRAARTA